MLRSVTLTQFDRFSDVNPNDIRNYFYLAK